MKRLFLLIDLLLAGAVVLLGQNVDIAKAWEKAEKGQPLTDAECVAVADSVHKRYITLDSHNDTALYLNHPEGKYSVTKGQVTFEKMKAGGLDAGFFAIYLGVL